MASRTQIVCLHEGNRGRSVDPIFIHALIRALDPSWVRRWLGSNRIRLVPCRGRDELMKRFTTELRIWLRRGGNTTLMVWCDLDHDMENGESLKRRFRDLALQADIGESAFESVVFVFPKDRIENWIQFLQTGTTDESKEGPRVEYPKLAAQAAEKLADRCRTNAAEPPLPPSLAWSCRNWRRLAEEMRG